MKKQTQYLFQIFLAALIFSACKQVSKSMDDTLNPKDTTTNTHKETVKPNDITSSHGPDRMKKVIDSQIQHVMKQVEMHTSKRINIPIESNVKDFLSNTTGLEKAEAALKQLPQYAGKEIFIYKLAHFRDNGSIEIKLQHPKNPKYVDNYTYKNGKWSEPEPEQLSVRDNIQSNLISLNNISFTSAARVNKTYNEKTAEIEGAKPTTSVYFYVRNGTVKWYPSSISGSRERYSIEFNSNGSLKSFNRD
ncbi:hypothetical protein [Pedobacter nototheniae]|uniref:hypothetical protein n=1 Tax=Pedobacter nototheniae TaxID=2488994 RepID=UPI00292D8EE3|nr:hypothetical protein [Pedobacter nototheniae]